MIIPCLDIPVFFGLPVSSLLRAMLARWKHVDQTAAESYSAHLPKPSKLTRALDVRTRVLRREMPKGIRILQLGSHHQTVQPYLHSTILCTGCMWPATTTVRAEPTYQPCCWKKTGREREGRRKKMKQEHRVPVCQLHLALFPHQTWRIIRSSHSSAVPFHAAAADLG